MSGSDYIDSGMRLAFRRDGFMWVAELQAKDKPPIVMGSVLLNALRDENALVSEFQGLMKRVVEIALRESAGIAPSDSKWVNRGAH